MYGFPIGYHTDHICPAIDGDFTFQSIWIVASFVFIPFAVVIPASCFETIVTAVVIIDVQGINIKFIAFSYIINNFCFYRCFCVAVLVNNDLHRMYVWYLRSVKSPNGINSHIFILNRYRTLNSGNLITRINSINYIRISTPALESHFHTLYCVMSRFYCAVQCIYFVLVCLYNLIIFYTAIHVISQLNGFFHRFFFGNFDFQISIRDPTKVICFFSNCYSVLIVSCHRNTDLFAGTNQFILCQYDFGNVPCSYIFRIGGVPEIIHGFISTQTISICKIFVTVNTYLFRKISI